MGIMVAVGKWATTSALLEGSDRTLSGVVLVVIFTFLTGLTAVALTDSFFIFLTTGVNEKYQLTRFEYLLDIHPFLPGKYSI